jgi:hypothetical protein
MFFFCIYAEVVNWMETLQEIKNVALRTTVTFGDDDGKLLEQWADLQMRPVGNLISAIVSSVLRDRPMLLPNELKPGRDLNCSERVLKALALGESVSPEDLQATAAALGIDIEALEKLRQEK